MVIYFTRFFERNPNYQLTESNFFLFMTTLILLEQKMTNDTEYHDSFYAKIGGIQDLKWLNRAEIRLLSLLDFDLDIDPETYNAYASSLANHIQDIVRFAVSGEIRPKPELEMPQGNENFPAENLQLQNPPIDNLPEAEVNTPEPARKKSKSEASTPVAERPALPSVSVGRQFRFMSDFTGIDIPWEGGFDHEGEPVGPAISFV
jgi:hypothetical protein